jgi:cytochrome c oxidase assembly protein subunit 11
MSVRSPSDLRRLHRAVALVCLAFVGAMTAMAFAAVPLYRLFCEATGFGGTTQRATAASNRVLDLEVEVRFDANVAPGLSWDFRPMERIIKAKLGDQVIIRYEAVSRSRNRTAGTATFNVSPPQAGAYFNKIDCFCFTEQVLQPGERLEMPVMFFIDPAFAADPDLGAVPSIVLSYTFFAAPLPDRPLAGAATAGPAPRL